MAGAVMELPELRDRRWVFRDRAHAGKVLASMLGDYRNGNGLVLAIPAGGVPVAAAMADTLHLPLDLCVVSKILLPWTTEAGFGAVAFDGSVWLNQAYIDHYHLTPQQIEKATQEARRKVAARVRRFRGNRPMPEMRGRPVFLVDDGLASGATLRAGLAALRRQGADRLPVAVPTAPALGALELAREADALYCANVRGGASFAVADAYQQWYDVSEAEVEEILKEREVL
jgi:Predicted phosphoribosyltransferases